MIIFDTDHLTVLSFPASPSFKLLAERMDESVDQYFATSIVSVEEQFRGWLAFIHRKRSIHQQLPAYDRLAWLLNFYGDWLVLPLDAEAAKEFDRLIRANLRIGTMDLKIAAIALANEATLLSSNSKDFGRIPGLHVESWIA